MSGPTQCDRLLAWLRENPGSSSLEITMALRLVNVTVRVSDLRARGHVIECRRDDRHVDRYFVVDKPQQLTAFG